MSERRWAYNPHFHRRSFLQRIGAAGFLAPFVPLLNASAQEATFPRRLILWFTPHGTIYNAWKPTVTGTTFTLGPILAPLERHKNKLIILDGMRIKTDSPIFPHTKGPPLLWTASELAADKTFSRGGLNYGWNTGPSVDQVIAAVIGGQTAYRSLEFGVRVGSNFPANRLIYTGPAQPLAPATDPYAAFTRLFANLTTSTTPAQQDQLRADRASVLDVLKTELNDVRLRTSVAERFKIDAHLAAIRDIEMALVSGSAVVAGCHAPVLPAKIDPNAAANVSATMDRHSDIVAAAFGCDLTRVASFQMRLGETDTDTYDFLGNKGEHHLTSHNPDSDATATAELVRLYTFYSQKFAYLLDKLDSIVEGNGTVLDNTLVVWGSEIGKGNNHSFEKIPFVLAGGAGGRVKPGRVMQLANVDHSRLLVSMCNLMGLPNVQTFGKNDVGQGPLAGL
jgi:hypothetical protein